MSTIDKKGSTDIEPAKVYPSNYRPSWMCRSIWDDVVFLPEIDRRLKGVYTIPINVTIIPSGAFAGCSGLTGIIVSEAVEIIWEDIFLGCVSLTSINVEPGNVKYDSRDNCNAIIETDSNTLIAGCRNTVIPHSIKTIRRCSFDYTGPSLIIPHSVTYIEEWAFQRTGELKSISVEKGNTIYDSRDNCNAIIETESNSLVLGCRNTVVPETVTDIGNYAFYHCTDLTSVCIPHSVTRIGNLAFCGADNLTSIVIPASVTKIGLYAFHSCEKLTRVEIQSELAEIGDCAFKGCKNLSEVVIPELSNNVFENCPNLTNVILTGYNNRIPKYAFSGCSKLSHIEIPDTVDVIKKKAFWGCKSLVHIRIPNSATGIGRRAFGKCTGLKRIWFPKSIREIGNDVFSGCDSLTELHLSAEHPEKIQVKFDTEHVKNISLYVPEELEDDYRRHPEFSKFKEVRTEDNND